MLPILPAFPPNLPPPAARHIYVLEFDYRLDEGQSVTATLIVRACPGDDSIAMGVALDKYTDWMLIGPDLYTDPRRAALPQEVRDYGLAMLAAPLLSHFLSAAPSLAGALSNERLPSDASGLSGRCGRISLQAVFCAGGSEPTQLRVAAGTVGLVVDHFNFEPHYSKITGSMSWLWREQVAWPNGEPERFAAAKLLCGQGIANLLGEVNILAKQLEEKTI